MAERNPDRVLPALGERYAAGETNRTWAAFSRYEMSIMRIRSTKGTIAVKGDPSEVLFRHSAMEFRYQHDTLLKYGVLVGGNM